MLTMSANTLLSRSLRSSLLGGSDVEVGRVARRRRGSRRHTKDIQKTYKILCVPLWEYSLSG